MTVPALLIVVVAVFVASIFGTDALRRYAERQRILDVPNARSMHSAPTPRGGGVVIASAALLCVLLCGILEFLDVGEAMAFAGALPIALVGWIDDRRGVAPLSRLLVQFGAATWAAVWLGGYSRLDTGAAIVPLGGVGTVLAILAIVWMTNLYNFMDGIDGLAGAEAVTSGGAVAVLLWCSGEPALGLTAAVLSAAAAGFLIFNWAPARIFLGDVGSGTLGFLFAVLALAGDRADAVPAIVLLLPFGVFIADATYTLARRALRRERLTAAHRTHVYQLLVQDGWSHRRVTLLVSGLNLLLALGAWVAWRRPDSLPIVTFGAVALLLTAAYIAHTIAQRERQDSFAGS